MLYISRFWKRKPGALNKSPKINKQISKNNITSEQLLEHFEQYNLRGRPLRRATLGEDCCISALSHGPFLLPNCEVYIFFSSSIERPAQWSTYLCLFVFCHGFLAILASFLSYIVVVLYVYLRYLAMGLQGGLYLVVSILSIVLTPLLDGLAAVFD